MRFVYLAHFTPGSRRGRQDKVPRNRINESITAKEVRCVDFEGKMLGVMPVPQALRLAEEQDMDLVEIAPQAKPPVCKIIDFGKFMYEQQKKEKHQRKQQLNQQMKEIRFKWRTDTHDFNFKTRHARQFIEEGHKVKASVMFRGREIVHKEIGRELLLKFISEMEDIAKIDAPMRTEGKLMHVVLSPEKGSIKKKKSE
ncbi:translation initiation factor IF-3 [Bacteroidota bacterium]